MAQLLGGLVIGIAMALGYVRMGWELPGFLQLPDKLKGNVVASSVEGTLLSSNTDPDSRQRALEVLFDNRAAYAAQLDAEMGHPFLEAYRSRHATIAARRLLLEWTALDDVLDKPALRAALEKKHGTADTLALKRAVLAAKLDAHPFLKAWMTGKKLSIEPEALRDSLASIGRLR